MFPFCFMINFVNRSGPYYDSFILITILFHFLWTSKDDYIII
ncbi:hypothetical protein HMPREF1548_05973 [Clostridium sp. KLE 1755]|nr:hypothetical protein HMPREF1548_05973 [Clostridium sp. KLE 1755]